MIVAGRTYDGLGSAADRLCRLQVLVWRTERRMLKTRVEMGLMLIDIKPIVGFGRWVDWLNSNGIHRRIASRSMKLARDAKREFPDLEPTELAEQYAKRYPSSRAAEVAIRGRQGRPVPELAEVDDEADDELELVQLHDDDVPGQMLLDRVYAQIDQRLCRASPYIAECAAMARDLDPDLERRLEAMGREFESLRQLIAAGIDPV